MYPHFTAAQLGDPETTRLLNHLIRHARLHLDEACPIARCPGALVVGETSAMSAGQQLGVLWLAIDRLARVPTADAQPARPPEDESFYGPGVSPLTDKNWARNVVASVFGDIFKGGRHGRIG